MAHQLDLSQLHPEMTSLWLEALACPPRNDKRGYTNGLLKAVLIAPEPWAYGRYFLWSAYLNMLISYPQIVNESDKNACQNILSNDKEPALFRAMAAFQMAAVFGTNNDPEVNVDFFRRVVEFVQCITTEEAARSIIVPTKEYLTSGSSTVGVEAQKWVHAANLNLRSLTNIDVVSREADWQEALRRQQTLLPETSQRSCIPGNYTPSANLPPEIMKRLEMGGQACDCCGKTLEQLGVVRINCCSVCHHAYYCGLDCQRKEWKAGHKGACRKPGEIKHLDWMKIRGLQSNKELNECVVMALRIDPTNPDRWIVRVYTHDDGVKDISVASVKLVHIRPAM